MKHANISIFVPHLGCPNDCSFCNQRHITGVANPPTGEDIENSVNIAINSPNYSAKSTEIAFFGGSFTAIDKDYMISLLSTAGKYVKSKCVCGIRISTRPDAIDADTLTVLKEYGVTAIELGAQSMVDEVLLANDRGHTSKDVVSASALIRAYGFELGLQMMTGLYKDTDEKAILTAKKIADIKPDTVRIYPTIVLEGTRLARLYREGVYTPQTVEDAVSLCVTLQDIFNENDINVIRIGLHSVDESSIVAGPWHPAFGELCESEKIFRNIVSSCEKGREYRIHIHPTQLSKAYGQKRSNLFRLQNEGYNITFIQDKDVEKNTILIRG